MNLARGVLDLPKSYRYTFKDQRAPAPALQTLRNGVLFILHHGYSSEPEAMDQQRYIHRRVWS